VPDIAARVALLAVFLVLACLVNYLVVKGATIWRDHLGTAGPIASIAVVKGAPLTAGLRCMDCARTSLALTFVPTLDPGNEYQWPGSGWACVLRLTLLIAGLLAWVLCLGIFMNFNRLSLHSTYRNRLMRAYLGASNPDRHPVPDGETATRTRLTDLYTGFDPADNVPMHHLRRTGCFTGIIGCAVLTSLTASSGTAGLTRG